MGRGFVAGQSWSSKIQTRSHSLDLLSNRHGFTAWKRRKMCKGLVASPLLREVFPRFLWGAAALPGWFLRGFADIYWEQLDLPIGVTRATQPGIDPTIGGWIVGKKSNLKNAFPELVKVLHPRSEQQRNNWTRKWFEEWNKVTKFPLDCALVALSASWIWDKDEFPILDAGAIPAVTNTVQIPEAPCCILLYFDVFSIMLSGPLELCFLLLSVFFVEFFSAVPEKNPRLYFTNPTNN